MGQRYYVDPHRIEALAKQLEEIGTLTRSMTEEFLDELAPTVNWPGTEGEFAEKAKPQEQKERQTTKDTMLSIRDALVGITDATLGNVRMMKDTRDRNIESVEQGTNRIDTDGLDGPGGHGRR
ncbi:MULTISPECIES: hypothetical protein [Streptomyces]|uniref:Uncharacterized protein n=1 Tax=Streptomyces glycanivorans TaxID=3033808 RepID=A0ABY9J7F1_9ACTN|nr:MULTISPECIES: hypothetical protein [unclassified Streptomyces]WSQ76976.1 hypothetical protein OG725_07670 [Streptomyces sp. NBC_01213]TXS13184.1 hypothetical protein EAO68_20020 [Streptomyces sp. wa22]WLQ63593.1 hypothetical protein P8A20_08335 [Streptomyces sp. Alt3]WSQ84305.1 hypothetical protein OG722_08100 [Streptomyces sp. NBC_01212]WSR09638.1 hypothetical protein OG265_28065 [Streptomyces sp. NBC_01208]